MRLEGTLDAFSLPDIFQLLSYTKKTGTLHLRRDGQHGLVHVRDGAVTGGRGDVALPGAGPPARRRGPGRRRRARRRGREVARPTRRSAWRRRWPTPARLDARAARGLAAEQATDAVFELLRWPDGDFAFVVDEPDPDDVGASLAVEDGRGRGPAPDRRAGGARADVPSLRRRRQRRRGAAGRAGVSAARSGRCCPSSTAAAPSPTWCRCPARGEYVVVVGPGRPRRPRAAPGRAAARSTQLPRQSCSPRSRARRARAGRSRRRSPTAAGRRAPPAAAASAGEPCAADRSSPSAAEPFTPQRQARPRRGVRRRSPGRRPSAPRPGCGWRIRARLGQRRHGAAARARSPTRAVLAHRP